MLTTMRIKKCYRCLSHGSAGLIIYTPFIFFLYLFFCQGPVWCEAKAVTVVEFKDDLFTCQAEGIPLRDILKEILSKCQVEISGLEEREDEPVSFNFEGNIEQGIRELMTLLGEKKFIFEFDDAKLTKVLSSKIEEIKTSKPFKIVFKNESPTITVVYDIAHDSQAEKFGLKIGDIIQEYDGVKIITAKISRQQATTSEGTPFPWARRTKMDDVAVTSTPNDKTR